MIHVFAAKTFKNTSTNYLSNQNNTYKKYPNITTC